MGSIALGRPGSTGDPGGTAMSAASSTVDVGILRCSTPSRISSILRVPRSPFNALPNPATCIGSVSAGVITGAIEVSGICALSRGLVIAISPPS